MNPNPERTPVGERVVIYARGKKKIYVADFWQDNAHCRLSLRTSNKKIAIERATKLAADLVQGSFHRPPPPITVADAVEAFLTCLRTDNRAPKTIVKYDGTFKLFIAFLARHGVTRMSQVTANHFDGFRAERSKTKHSNTVNNQAVSIKSLWKWAKSRKLIAENLLVDIRLKKPRSEPKPAPSLDQVNQILTAADEPLASQLAVLAFTGVRSGELQRLRPQDIDLGGNWIHIRSRPGAETKSRESRKVPIHLRLRRLLETLAKVRQPWLFTTRPSSTYPAGGNRMNTKRMNDQFVRLAARLELPVGRKDGFVVHSLRHFFETFIVNAGIPQRVIDTWLGHRSDKSMAAVYYRLGDEDSQSFMIKVPFGTEQPAAIAGKEDVPS